MRLEHGLKQTLNQRIDPKLIMANNILQLTTMELQQAIEQELAENPALEVPEEDACENCDQPKTLCIDCPLRKQLVSSDEVDLSIYELEQPAEFFADADEETDFISNIGEQITLHEHLTSMMRASLPEEKWRIGDYIIANIGDSGYLECSVEEIAFELGESPEEVESVLSVIQTFDPPGVGARNLQECLRIQLTRLAEEDRGNAVASAIVDHFFQDMLSGRTGRIARRLKVPVQQVVEAIEFIRKQLNPYPGNAFRSPFASDSDRSTAGTIKPDVIVRKTEAGYEVEVVGYEQYFLRVSPKYRAMYEELKNGKANQYSEEDRKHVTEFVERAELFIKYINERRRTLRQITKAIVEYQQGYIETGSRAFLRPLTRTKLAKVLGMHESTVSRATAGKYVQLPSEEVVPFDFFFDGSASVKDMIIELIKSEDPSNPLSDQQIADILRERGYNVARRTVVKYREAEKILSSRQRRV
ncbi:MAG: RNA polymerase factor sigma-54 [Armatimonadota bacterium]|nr:RNA polymerase factor sigma-54 [Armatimonadota bacterium]